MYLTDIPFIADFMNNSYTFDLDAACVYYFSAGSDVAYAGDQNFTSMTFGANLDDDTVGAEGTVAYWPAEDSENSVTAYLKLFIPKKELKPAVEEKKYIEIEG